MKIRPIPAGDADLSVTDAYLFGIVGFAVDFIRAHSGGRVFADLARTARRRSRRRCGAKRATGKNQRKKRTKKSDFLVRHLRSDLIC